MQSPLFFFWLNFGYSKSSSKDRFADLMNSKQRLPNSIKIQLRILNDILF